MIWPDCQWSWPVDLCPDRTVIHVRNGVAWATVGDATLTTEHAGEQIALSRALGGTPGPGMLTLLAIHATLDPANYPDGPPNRDSLLFALKVLTQHWGKRRNVLDRQSSNVERTRTLLVALSHAPEPSTRVDVANRLGRGGEEQAILARLVRDEDSAVRDAAITRALTVPGLRNSLDVDVALMSAQARREVAVRVDIDGPTLESLSRDSHPKVRAAVARHPRCPVSIVERLAKDRAANVRGWAASSPAAPLNSLMAVAGDSSVAARSLLVRSSRVLPAEVLAVLRKDRDPQIAAAARARSR